jgi:hypothetical protein
MTTPREEITRMIDELRAQRDVLRVRLHLACAEARDEWEALEKRWEHLRARAAVVGREATETAENVGAALLQVGDELKQGYERLRALV